MSDYIVSARKYRPQSFKTVVGQKTLVQTLKNAILSHKLAHAYLFCGPRGVGKTTCARIFAKTINCQHLSDDGEACGQCDSCRSFDEQCSYNVYELDAASNNGVDQIRELIDQVQIPPQVGQYKVFIIDEVHMLSQQAFNAFLKTLEEPPRHAIFVLCTTEKQKILPTILSRCQTYDFQRITVQDIVGQLSRIAQEEGVKAEPQALQVIAKKADGGMRDALSVFDQIVSFTGGDVTYQSAIDNLNILDYEIFFRVTDAALQGNIPAALLMLDEVLRRGFESRSFISGWAGHLRDLMVAKEPTTVRLIEAAPDVVQRYCQQAVACPPAFLYPAAQIAAECDFNYRNAGNKRLSVELAIVRICQLLHPVQPIVPQGVPQGVPQPAPQQARPAQQPAAQRPAGAYGQPVAQRPVPQPTAQQQPMASQQPMAQRSVQPVAQQQPMQQQPVTSQQPVRPMQPAPQPAPQSAAPPVHVVDAANRFGQRPGGPHLASLRVQTPAGQPTTAAAPDQQAAADMDEPVEPEALRRAWRQYTNTIPGQKLLINVMNTFRPQPTEGSTTHYRIEVQSKVQQDIYLAHRADVQRALRQALRNSHIDIECVVAESSSVRRAFTPREKLKEMMADNPAVEELVNVFGLELA